MSTINIKGKGRHVIESGPCVVTGVRLSSANRTGFSLKTSTGRHQSVGMVTNGKPIRFIHNHHARAGLPNKRHGHATHGISPELRSFYDARKRCTNTKCIQYPYYGGRGIKFLFDSFEQFYAELGPRPKGLSL